MPCCLLSHLVIESHLGISRCMPTAEHRAINNLRWEWQFSSGIPQHQHAYCMIAHVETCLIREHAHPKCKAEAWLPCRLPVIGEQATSSEGQQTCLPLEVRDAEASKSQANGISKIKVEPPPSRSSYQRSPPMSRARSRAKDKPSPVDDSPCVGSAERRT